MSFMLISCKPKKKNCEIGRRLYGNDLPFAGAVAYSTQRRQLTWLLNCNLEIIRDDSVLQSLSLLCSGI